MRAAQCSTLTLVVSPPPRLEKGSKSGQCTHRMLLGVRGCGNLGLGFMGARHSPGAGVVHPAFPGGQEHAASGSLASL